MTDSEQFWIDKLQQAWTRNDELEAERDQISDGLTKHVARLTQVTDERDELRGELRNLLDTYRQVRSERNKAMEAVRYLVRLYVILDTPYDVERRMDEAVERILSKSHD